MCAPWGFDLWHNSAPVLPHHITGLQISGGDMKSCNEQACSVWPNKCDRRCELEPFAASAGYSGCGVDVYLPLNDPRPDLFVWRDQHYAFPCCACVNVRDETGYCRGCKHFSL